MNLNLKAIFLSVLMMLLVFGSLTTAKSVIIVDEASNPTTPKGFLLSIQVYNRNGPYGNPLPQPGVYVTVQNKNNPLIKRTLITGAFGYANFNNIPYGTYILKLRIKGYTGWTGLDTEIEYSFLGSFFTYYSDDFDPVKSKSCGYPTPFLQRIVEKFPMFEQLLMKHS